jgi:hypothetical protein
MDMFKTNLFVFIFGIIVGGTLYQLTVNAMKEDIGAISSSLESKLDNISQQLSDSWRFNQEVKPATSGEDCKQSANWKKRLTNLEQSLQWALETSMRPIIQEELDFIVSRFPQDKQVVTQQDQVVDPHVIAERMAKAEQVLTTAISNGVWTQQDMDAYNDELSHLSGEALAEAFEKLFAAINRGDIEVSVDTLLF